MKLTVYFEGEFWVGILEETLPDGKVRACRHIFGAEPRDPEVLQFVMGELTTCWERTGPRQVGGAERTASDRRINPKRLARMAAEEMRRQGPSDRAKEALMQELEHRKKERKVLSREEREAAKERKRELARLKAKEKHKGH